MKYVSLENLVELLKVAPEDILIVVGEIRSHIKGYTRVRDKQLYFTEKAVLMIKQYLSVKGNLVKQKVSELVNRNPAGSLRRNPQVVREAGFESYMNEKVLLKFEKERQQLLKMLENSNRELFEIRRELVEAKNNNQLLKDEISLLVIENHLLLDQEERHSTSVATNLQIA